MSIFLTPANELRSEWKFVLYIVFFILIWFATGIALSAFVAPRADDSLQDRLFILALNEIGLLVPAIGAMWLSIRFVDHRPFRTFGIGLLPRWRREFLIGLAIAAGMLGVLIAGCYAFGYVNMHWTGGQVPVWILLATFSLLLLAAANEELMFRGFPLQVLVEGLGKWPATIGMSVLFGLIHLGNPNASLLGTANTVVAGILLSLAYVRTRSLWMPYAIHVGWNVGLGFVFGFPLSGVDIASLWTTGVAGSDLILGGDYGPEGGLLATFVFAVAALIVETYGSVNRGKARPRSTAWGRHRN
jgi:membrane protease YdiL (CAAX protease family)